MFDAPSAVSISGTGKAQAEAAIRIAELELEKLSANWHAWKPGPLGFVNQRFRTGSDAFTYPDGTESIIRDAQRLALLSDQLFNPAIGDLKAAWGFHGSDPATLVLPEKPKVEKLVATNPRMEDVQLTRRRIFSSNSAVQLDFGAFGAGYAIDLTVERLRQVGLGNASVRVGGITRAYGNREGQRWQADIDDPRTPNTRLATLPLADGEALAVISDTDQAYEAAGQRIHPTIDPRTGYPAKGSRLAAVLHSDAATAAAAATAIFVAGKEAWYRIARQMGVHYALLMDDEGRLYMNPEMKDRVEFDQSEPPITLSESLADATPMELPRRTNQTNRHPPGEHQPSDEKGAPPTAESGMTPAGG